MDQEEEKKTEEKCPVSDEEMKDVSGGNQQGSSTPTSTMKIIVDYSTR